MIVDGRGYWARSLDEWAKRPDFLTSAASRSFTVRPVTVVAEDAEPAPVYINHGRLFARCWSRGCGGAELVWRERPQIWCTSCGNGEINGFWRPVAMPDDALLDLVDRILGVRPEHERNWLGTEPLSALVAENLAHDLPVPDDAPPPLEEMLAAH